MMYIEVMDLDVQSEDTATLKITLPRRHLDNETVVALRKDGHGQQTVEMVGLLAYLTERFGSYYREELLNQLFYSMASFDLFDDPQHIEALRNRFEQLCNDYGQAEADSHPKLQMDEVAA